MEREKRGQLHKGMWEKKKGGKIFERERNCAFFFFAGALFFAQKILSLKKKGRETSQKGKRKIKNKTSLYGAPKPRVPSHSYSLKMG